MGPVIITLHNTSNNMYAQSNTTPYVRWYEGLWMENLWLPVLASACHADYINELPLSIDYMATWHVHVLNLCKPVSSDAIICSSGVPCLDWEV